MKKTHLIILSLFLTSAIIITAAVITYKALTIPKSKEYVVETIEANSKGYNKSRHYIRCTASTGRKNLTVGICYCYEWCRSSYKSIKIL